VGELIILNWLVLGLQYILNDSANTFWFNGLVK
jgi:hypothetical protein